MGSRGLTDDEETNVYGTDPLVADTDGDGLEDGYEIANGLNPLDPTDCPVELCPPPGSAILKLIPLVIQDREEG